MLEVFPNPDLGTAFPGDAVFSTADAVENTYASMAGYGRPAFPGAYLADAEHFKIRMGVGRRTGVSLAPHGLSDEISGALVFSDGLNEQSRSTPGNSGMPIYNSLGQILGIGLGSTGGLDQFGFTFYTKTSAFVPWVFTVMTPEAPKILNVAHGPTTATITVQAELVEIAYGKWVIEESPDLTTWSGTHAISNGVGMVPVVPGAAKRYYRLKFLFDTPPVTAGNP